MYTNSTTRAFGGQGRSCTSDVSYVTDLQSAALAARHTDAYEAAAPGIEPGSSVWKTEVLSTTPHGHDRADGS